MFGSKAVVGGAFAVLATASAMTYKLLSRTPADPAPPLSSTPEPTMKKPLLLSVLEASLAHVKSCTSDLYKWSAAQAKELKKQRRGLNATYLAMCKAKYETELSVLDARVFRTFKVTEAQVSNALAYYGADPDVREAVQEVEKSGPKFHFEASELLRLYTDIFEVQLLHMETTADELAESGLKRGTKPFQAAISARLQVEAERIKSKYMAEQGLTGVDSFLEANLDMYVHNDNVVAVKFNHLMSEQQRRAVACGARSSA